MSPNLPPARGKWDSDTLIGLSAQDALRRKQELDGVVPVPLPSLEPTFVGPVPTHPPPPPIHWPPPWQSDEVDTDVTAEDWCASLRSGPVERVLQPPPSAPAIIPGSIHPSTEAVFVATLPPTSAPSSRIPMFLVLGLACASVVAMAIVAAVQSREEGPVWRLAQGLPETTPATGVQEEPAKPVEAPKSEAPSAPPATEFGTLVIDAGPRACDLWIDGVGRIVRGRAALRVPPGPHSLACRRNGKVEGRRVVVASGKSAHVRFSR
ncbi:MAG TPA: hypothetical protein VFB62_09300, partial [Polyangiaceae bacterium]|jgi:hypothetical protein|nr:hypothetical protein [Polyangiaceae bacterium]